MITTRQIDVNLEKGKLKHRHVTTKDINAGVRVEPPKEPIKPRSITTNVLPDVADIAEKKKRAEIVTERKKAESKKGDIETVMPGTESFDISDAVYQKATTVSEIDDKTFDKMNTQYVFVEIDGEVQAVSRRELKWA